MVGYFIVIFVMIILSAFFSGSEISFNASNKTRLKKAADEGKKAAALALEINDRFTEALSAILIGNNLANIAASTAATLIFSHLFENLKLDEGVKGTLVTILSTALITVLILILGEITPKIIAKQHADKIVCFVAYPVKILKIILFPIVKLVMLLVNLLRKTWGNDRSEDEPSITEDELASIIETVEDEGVIDEDKSDMLRSALEFPETDVEEIMTPRTMMISINVDDSMEKIAGIIATSRYSRIPVYSDNIDNIVGILYLNHYYKEAVDHPEGFDLRPILMHPCYLHKTMKLPTALKVMRQKHVHLAIVIDEFGGTMGIVTLEDILEELVGDIWDESDIIVKEIVRKGDGKYSVSGDMNVYDFFDEFDYEPDDDFECENSTVGGWATEMLNAEPHVGDSFSFENIRIEILGIERLHVTRLLVEILPVENADDEETEE